MVFMEFAISKYDITPKEPTYMEGYGGRNQRSKGVHENIYVKSLLIKNNKEMVLITCADVCIISRELSDQLKKNITENYPLKEENILITATHLHSGPALETWLMHEHDESYVDYFKSQVLNSVKECFESLQEGTMEFSSGETYIGMNRRQKTEKGVRLAPNPEAEIDRTLNVFTIKDKSETIRAIVFNCSCHPTIMGGSNYLISAEFPGFACNELESKYEGSIAMFLQGTPGDINPAIISKGKDYRESYFSDIEFTGKVLANDVNHLIKYGMKDTIPSLASSLKEVHLPLGEFKIDEFNRMAKSEESYWKEYGSKILKQIENGNAPKEVSFNIGLIKISKDIIIVALEGEICNDYGKWIRNLNNKIQFIIAGYSNGYKSYLPTKEILDEGGYEATVAYTWSGFPAPYSDKVESIVLNAIKDELNNLL